MIQNGRSQLLGGFASAALAAALVLCFAVVLFHWPDPQDRKRAIPPKVIAKIRSGVAVGRAWAVLPPAVEDDAPSPTLVASEAQ
jgi:hypothetical protein